MIFELTSSLVNNFLSLGEYWANPSAALVRGIIVTYKIMHYLDLKEAPALSALL